ncbi:IS66 family insertion sequence element accessory protein TnpB [Synoicihabitans lomoniglobus]|uniref:IS66 family insertion sequence element accessory protein TnpB n=1 Tax=Synoicihabitans lomoniglobus TaxID=2909285 RepID=A0AAE9ZWH4_9BACT|nr:IS66 family insertion sequence element accessory protein TnpB [Opitutaceae bacterium LMO-M01]WED66366.1 IS66 family insertion sequence element accessory protein TnpB [Opitutaceae bacterium LMO-M01]WED66578.1 IS66 family insertion sequence element accessory protein TnpB [Opitutaceae bacterium LMO-M01]WED66825.1 IS66 family insertion sequence element accessory protein TnpB [Opitutaceae bacterium LMO-M01]
MARIEAEQIYVYGGVVDLRKGANSLRTLVGRPEPEALYVFSNRSRGLLKFLVVDATGVWCGTRRLHHRRFAWPESPDGQERLTRDELAWLIAGGDVKKLRLKRTLAGQ